MKLLEKAATRLRRTTTAIRPGATLPISWRRGERRRCPAADRSLPKKKRSRRRWLTILAVWAALGCKCYASDPAARRRHRYEVARPQLEPKADPGRLDTELKALRKRPAALGLARPTASRAIALRDERAAYSLPMSVRRLLPGGRQRTTPVIVEPPPKAFQHRRFDRRLRLIGSRFGHARRQPAATRRSSRRTFRRTRCPSLLGRSQDGRYEHRYGKTRPES